MFYVIIRFVKIQFAIAVSLLLFTACSSAHRQGESSSENNSQPLVGDISTMMQKMNADKNPQNHINSIRMYALNNFNDLSDKEAKLIQSAKPEIYNNSETLEYCFVWTLPNTTTRLEVVATPPPDCTPIAVFRRNRVYFP